MLDLSLWGSIIHRRRPAKKEVARVKGWGSERKMNRTMSSLCHPAYCERHKSEQWCTRAAAGVLCMLIFIDLAHPFMSRGHCLSTHRSAKLAVSFAGEPARGTHAAHPFLEAPAHTCHLPGLVIIMQCYPVPTGAPGVVGVPFGYTQRGPDAEVQGPLQAAVRSRSSDHFDTNALWQVRLLAHK